MNEQTEKILILLNEKFGDDYGFHVVTQNRYDTILEVRNGYPLSLNTCLLVNQESGMVTMAMTKRSDFILSLGEF